MCSGKNLAVPSDIGEGSPMPAQKTTPVPIRFDSQVRERLQAVSSDCGLSVSDLCRLAVEKLLTELETTGQITLRVSEEVSGYTTNKPT